jgi:hypothetical protein
MRLPAAGLTLLIVSGSSFAQGEGMPLLEGCSWKDHKLALDGVVDQELKFRFQDCTGKHAAKAAFSLDKDNRLMMTIDGHSSPVAQFWLLKGEKPSALIPRLAEPSVDAKERGRCEVILDGSTGRYSYAPNAAYMEELLGRDEPYWACGDYGDTNDSVQYFIVIGNRLLGYLWVGQDTPLYDPDSFVHDTKK